MDKYETSTNDGASWVILPSLSITWIIGSLTWRRSVKPKVDEGQTVNSGGMLIRKVPQDSEAIENA